MSQLVKFWYLLHLLLNKNLARIFISRAGFNEYETFHFGVNQQVWGSYD